MGRYWARETAMIARVFPYGYEASQSGAGPPDCVGGNLMPGRESSIADALRCYGIPRRKFLKFCGSMAAVLGLPLGAAAQIAATLEKKRRPVLVWLELQDCAGNS